MKSIQTPPPKNSVVIAQREPETAGTELRVLKSDGAFFVRSYIRNRDGSYTDERTRLKLTEDEAKKLASALDNLIGE